MWLIWAKAARVSDLSAMVCTGVRMMASLRSMCLSNACVSASTCRRRMLFSLQKAAAAAACSRERDLADLVFTAAAGQASDDAVARLPGETRPLRFTTVEKKGFFTKLFGG